MRFPIGQAVIPPRMPGIARSARSLVATTAEIAQRTVSGKRVRATEAERQAQLAVCQACDRHVDGRCSVCGCFVSLKSWLIGFCPLGKHTVDTST